MNDPQFSRQKSTFLSSVTQGKLEELVWSYPFTKQLDLVVPLSDSSNDELLEKLCSSSCGYVETSLKLGDAVYALDHRENGTIMLSGPKLSSGPESGDAWCLDTRGFITLSVCEDTHQSLGLTGTPIGIKKGRRDTYAIRLPQKPTKQQLDAIARWDLSHKPEGVLYATPSGNPLSESDGSGSTTKSVKPTAKTYTDTVIPVPTDLLKQPQPAKSDPSSLEDWELAMHETFEWVGLAALGAPGLRATDPSTSFVSSYAPPEPNRTGTIVHLRWRGLLHPHFTKSIVEIIASYLASLPSEHFISLVGHGFSGSPVSYVPHRDGKPRLDSTPVRLVHPDEGRNSEDSWCLLLGRNWGIVQEWAGFGDMRWG
jgi:ribonuclease P/MRP protein subunit RPP40